MNRFWDTILNVSVPDPDDARRRRLLNIILVGNIAGAVVGFLAIGISNILANQLANFETVVLAGGAFVAALGCYGIYQINRRLSGRWASLLYLLLLTLVFTSMDTPAQLSNGRSIFLFTIPIAISSLILLPEASFLFALLGSGIIAGLALSIQQPVNIFAIIGFFLLALVSWLSARSLESALHELRVINANLDQVVYQRTQALAESLARERLEAGRNQAILNSIADGVIVFDRNWNAILVNPAIRSLLDLPVELIVNRNFRELIEHPKLSARSRGLLYAMIEHDTQPLSFRIEWGNKTLSVSAAQVYDFREEGNINLGTVTVFRDFTREAEVERLKSSFVAIVSHELRTPLNAILGYAEMFREEVYGPMNEKQVNMANRIISNTRRLLGLINDLLDQAQMEAGKLTIHMGPVRPSELLEQIHNLLDKTAAEKKLRITSEMDDSLPETIIGDGPRLEQILVNLVTNAIKFTDQGEIRIRLFHLPEFRKWGIEVTDTGRGIPRSELPHIFDSFRQVEEGTTRTHSGVGLGLAIVKQLVNLMNGEIKAASEVGQGSVFTVTLPLVTPP
ncbi:MAG: sensor histidine kinase [Chloroflexota bacterium]|nr:PAS-domain containing protein [Chloroflexota bacterium]MBI5702499.1 PAS-domain containing protein [Chloroflexota bacterium]